MLTAFTFDTKSTATTTQYETPSDCNRESNPEFILCIPCVFNKSCVGNFPFDFVNERKLHGNVITCTSESECVSVSLSMVEFC